MNRLTQISLKNSAAVLILSIILILGGVYSATTLRVESMPYITFPYLVVSATYPASPSDVLDQVTKPIEKTIAGMDGVRFREQVRPGDVLRMEVELLRVRGSMAKAKGVASVDGKVAAEGEILLAVGPKQNDGDESYKG